MSSCSRSVVRWGITGNGIKWLVMVATAQFVTIKMLPTTDPVIAFVLDAILYVWWALLILLAWIFIAFRKKGESNV